TDHVKKSKISTLTREYQLFKMQEGEGVEITLEKLNKMINCLKMLGKEFTEEEIVDKVLWSLTSKWDS
ncbi:hypothetical protein PIB30_106403, partial [Stylosanthes scabra]|nr:hypothetical protein [Stylosanthes scabra]